MSSTTTQERIITLLQQAFAPSKLEVKDESYQHRNHPEAKKQGGGHFRLVIAALAFEGKSKVECHRMIYQALASEMPSNIHALAIEIEK